MTTLTPPDSAPVADTLHALLESPGVTDVLVNGPADVWVDRGVGLERTDVHFGSEGEVRGLAVRLAAQAGRRLDDASPLVDARLPSGARMHAALPPIADHGTTISIRTVRTRAMTLDDLMIAGTIDAPMREALEGLVRDHASLLVTGATGAGKTTLLASLLTAVDPTERLVLIEEAGELNPDHPHVVRLVERRANVDAVGAVELPVLVREALRMRPDRIVLGECRGVEVRDVLTALNTGHRGGMATLHANSAADVPTRLSALGALAGMDRRAVALFAAAAFEAVIHVERTPLGRRVAEISRLELEDDDRLTVRALVTAGSR